MKNVDCTICLCLNLVNTTLQKKLWLKLKSFLENFINFGTFDQELSCLSWKLSCAVIISPIKDFGKPYFLTLSLSSTYIYIFEIPLAICKIKPSLVVLIFLRASKCYFCILIITRWIKFMFYIWGKIVFQMCKEPVLHFSIYIGIPKNLVETWTM